LEQAYAASTLPEEPPREEMNRFLVQLRLKDLSNPLANN
jgi:hypothetical protein